jgi:hypothetical protein
MAFGGVGALAAEPPVATLEGPQSGALDPMADRAAVPTAREAAPTGNPLWGIPLRVLTATRERPLFSPSRRPPAPPAVAAPQLPPHPVAATKPEPDHPLLTVVGTIVGETEGIGVFIDDATKDVIRLHTGQDHDGWVLRSVQGRETVFERKDRTAKLALPALPANGSGPGPGSTPAPNQPGQASAPVPAAAQPGNTWMDGDGQLITPPKTIQAAGKSR